MSTKRWRGDALATSQDDKWTFSGSWTGAEVITVTINGKVWSYTATLTVIATIIDNLITAFAALDSTIYPEFTELTATRSSSDLHLAATTPGIPFTAAVAVSG